MSEKQNGGWIKLHRKSLHSSVMSAGVNVWGVWCWCLLKASHQTTVFPFNGQDNTLLPGQFIMGRVKAAKELGISEQRLRSALTYLKSTSRITIKTTNKYSMITVLKWNKYQQDNQQLNQQLTSNQPTTNHIQEGIKKVKKQERVFFQKTKEPNTLVRQEDFIAEYHRRHALGWRALYNKDLVCISNNKIRLKIFGNQFVDFNDSLLKVTWVK